jgi:hypothetical protein
MVKSGLAALIIGFALFRANAEDTYLFTWHGDSNFFQASFEATQADLHLSPSDPPVMSDLFRQTASLTRPDGITIREDWYAGLRLTGPGLNDGMTLALRMGDDGPSVTAESSAFPGYPSSMDSGPHGIGSRYTQYWYETGVWTISEIPEPSIAALSVLGVITFLARKRFA